MKTCIAMMLDHLSEQERKDLTYLLTDALGEFITQRENTEQYIENRYAGASEYLWDAQRIEVPARVALAKKLKEAAHTMRLADVPEESDDDLDELARREESCTVHGESLPCAECEGLNRLLEQRVIP